MKISEKFQYPGTDVEGVFALIGDAAFREESAAAQGATDLEVSVVDGTITIIRTQESDMPDFVKKLTGPTVKVKQTEVWSDPAADGSRSAKVAMSIIGQPAGLEGTAKLTPDADGVIFLVEGDVTVKIPFLGKKIEPEVAKAIVASLKADVAAGVARL